MNEDKLEVYADMLMNIVVLTVMTMLSGLSAYFLFVLSGMALMPVVWYTITVTAFFGIFTGLLLRKSEERHKEVLGVN